MTSSRALSRAKSSRATALVRAEEGRGKFRSFLLKSLTNYVLGEIRRAQVSDRTTEDHP
jgi:hypothetical protein